jgi:hypothetical protein
MTDAYVDWREDSAAVESAYRRWLVASSPDTAVAFAAYNAALDREEMASIAYERVIRRSLGRLARRRRSAATRRRAGWGRHSPRGRTRRRAA